MGPQLALAQEERTNRAQYALVNPEVEAREQDGEHALVVIEGNVRVELQTPSAAHSARLIGRLAEAMPPTHRGLGETRRHRVTVLLERAHDVLELTGDSEVALDLLDEACQLLNP